ncbi:transcription elongation factor, mitochondrial isoform X2 [Halyomorpha halys]|uniref:transcription elongation factor, mitochondrial isoform X2 n=1 Tax=Halyomorpha halys TaxID=286706 RepID=UPI000D0C921D|nr:transcription elongation factor, mitochondrial isoform X2 [Halyomorpha halys]
MSMLSVLVRKFDLKCFSTCQKFLQRIYSSQEKELILNKINEKDLPKSLNPNQLTKIYQYVEKKKLTTLEDLLNINGIGPKVLRKICDTVLDTENGTKEVVKDKRKVLNFVTPPIGENQKKDLIDITAIHIGADHISWVLINSLNKSLLEWDFKEYMLDKGSIYDFLSMIERIVPHIPHGHIYVLEEMGSGRNHIDYNRNLITAILSSYIQGSRGEKKEFPIVAFLKPVVKNNLYKATIGSERVSLQNQVVSIIEEKSSADCLNFPQELKTKFFSSKPSTREDMAQALLSATSFINVILNGRTLNFVRP